MRGLSPALITDVAEIDLYECRKYVRTLSNGELRAYLPKPYRGYVYIPMCRTKQRYGWRLWFLAPCCHRRVSKLYIYPARIACRHCFDLKYPSQYKKDAFSKSMMNHHKLQRLEKQKRRLWYDGYPTQFGVQYRRLMAEKNVLNDAIIADTWRTRMELAVAQIE